MREAEFKAWLEAQGYDTGTVSAQLARVARLERAYGDIDTLHADGGLERLQRELAYSKDDERAGKPNPATFAIDGDLYKGLASVRTTINYYLQFIEAERVGAGRAAHAALIARLTAADIEATMDDCDAAGVDGFLRQYGYVRPSNWVIRPANGQRYPAKAIVGIAVGKLPGEAPLRASEYFGGFGESQSYARLRELGYTIIGKEASRSFLLFDSDGAAFKPVRNGERDGRSVFKIKPAGASNRAEDAIKVETIAEVARAMLIDRLPARVQSVHGGQVNYIGYGKQKLVRYELDPAIAEEIGVPPVSSVDHSPFESGYQEKIGLMAEPTNLILYGPPGTGKTYATAAEAVRLCGEVVPDEREELMTLYRSLHNQGRIEFVTFHQNFSYEDFVEGLRPATGQSEEPSAGFELRPEPGIFRRMAEAAAMPIARPEAAFELGGRRIFKLSLGEAGKREWEWVYEQSIEDGYALFGFRDIDWSDARFSDRNEILAELQKRYPDEKITFQTGLVKSPDRFRNQLSVGDVVIISKGLNAFRAIGVVEGDYEYAPRPEGRYCHRRKVRWLWEEPQGVPVEEISSKRFSLDTVYELPKNRLNLAAIERYINSGDEGETNGEILQHVLIIDEINRANISKVFGELITLLEPDKRLGMPDALTVRLPYSKREFGVPSNLHIVGTMNTADRSIALLDTALRRRFVFREIAPDPSLLPEDVDGIALRQVLETLNDRIEYLVDREHRIGHAFFIGCRDRAAVNAAMRDKVIPLLQEYFFEDWGRVAAVLGERPGKGGGFLDCRKLKDPSGQGGEERESWSVRPQFAPDAYERLIGKPVVQSADTRADHSIEEAAE